ncbi:MAG: CPBP family intramembrane glutamic endopeptidase [Christensenellales bacterium]|jgi:membrane protease YdiL (CAAX protease family)
MRERRAALWYLIACIGNIAISLSVYYVNIPRYLAQLLFETLFLAAPCFLALYRRDMSSEELLLRPMSFSMAITGVFSALLCMYLANDVSVLWSLFLEKLGMRITSAYTLAASDKWSLAGEVLLVGAVPGICEELFFRSYFMNAWGGRRKVFLSALFFALLHGVLGGFPVHLFLGLILAKLAYESGSVYTAMVFHTVYNSALTILSFLQARLPDAQRYAEMSVTQYVASSGGIGAFLPQMAFLSLILYTTLSFAFARWRAKGARDGLDALPARGKRDAWAVGILAAAVLLMLYVYATDAQQMLRLGVS